MVSNNHLLVAGRERVMRYLDECQANTAETKRYTFIK